MSRAVRPIHIPGAAALESLRARVVAALEDWSSAWLRGGTSAAVIQTLRLGAASIEANSQIREFEAIRTDAGCLWLRCVAADRENLGRAVVGKEMMHGSRGADDWIAAVIDRAAEARNRALVVSLFGTARRDMSSTVASPPPADLFAFGSGAVQFSCAALGLFAIADDAVWRSVPPRERNAQPRLPKLTSLDLAVRNATLRVEVFLGSVEVELPKLLDLRCGDIVRLPQRLNEPIAVQCEGLPLARAALGESGGRKCVQVVTDQP